jgi:hypothetical protein
MPFIQFQIRRGVGADWVYNNPTLAAGEFGYETDTRKLKIGDGVTPWNSLPFFAGSGGVGPPGPTGPAGPTGPPGPSGGMTLAATFSLTYDDSPELSSVSVSFSGSYTGTLNTDITNSLAQLTNTNIISPKNVVYRVVKDPVAFSGTYTNPSSVVTSIVTPSAASGMGLGFNTNNGNSIYLGVLSAAAFGLTSADVQANVGGPHVYAYIYV